MRPFLFLGGLSFALAQSGFSNSSSPLNSSSTVTTSIPASETASSRSTLTQTLSLTSSIPASPSSSATLASTTVAGNGTITPTRTGSLGYTNPWAGNYSSPLPTTGTGSAYALQCQNAYYSWTSINEDYINATIVTYMSTHVIRSTTVYEIHTYYSTSYYTLCDGHPRVITSVPTTVATTTLLPSTTTFLAGNLSQTDFGFPSCTVSWDDCRGLWSQYESASSVYDEVSFSSANTVVSLGPGGSYFVAEGTTTTLPEPFPMTISYGTETIMKLPLSTDYLVYTTPKPGELACFCGHTMKPGGDEITIQKTIDFVQTPYTPECRTAQPTCTAGQKCMIDGDRVEIFWFPPQTNVSRDMCATAPNEAAVTSRPPTNFTWTPITTGPSAIVNGETWYSGNVYVSLNRINARCDWSGTPVEVGEHRAGQILTMAPSELYSQRAIEYNSGDFSGVGWEWEDHAYSFNLNDLVSPYPWSAWVGAPQCVMDRCTSINGSYNPWIAVPEAIRRLDAKWATCDLALYGLYDPPVALSTVTDMFPPTTTADDPRPEPTPGQSVPQTQVDPTIAPQPTSDPQPNPPDDDPPENNPPANPSNNPPVNPPSQPTSQPDPPNNDPDTPQPGQPNNPPQPGQPSNPQPGQTNNVPQPGQPGQTNNAPQPGQPGQTNNAPQPGQPGQTNNVPQPGQPGQTNNIPQPGQPGQTNVPQPGQPGQTNNVPQPGQPGQTQAPVPVPAPPTTIGTIGTDPVVVDPSNPTEVIIGTTTLTPGGPAFTPGPGTSVSVVNPGQVIISTPGAAAPSTINFPTAPAPTAPAPTTIGAIGNTPIVVNPANPTEVIIGTTTLTPGGPAFAPGPGTSVSVLDPGHLVISTPGAAAPSTINLPVPVASGAPAPSQGAVITLPGGELVTATAVLGDGTATSLLVDGTMFSAGGPPITLDNGVVLSQAPGGTAVVVVDPASGVTATVAVSDVPGIADASATAAAVGAGATPVPTPGAVVTIGGEVYTVIDQGGSLVIPELGVTLSEGGTAVTIDGTVVSDAGTGVVVGSTTQQFSVVTVVTITGLVETTSGGEESTSSEERSSTSEATSSTETSGADETTGAGGASSTGDTGGAVKVTGGWTNVVGVVLGMFLVV
ncbi:hypothetical protein BS50DRAFT_577740 [Corynespora cassiicola Philippines]|uniref:VWFD domain-containing protein n=1 Tax=Corynespora cassiicola Philippines TaxID=1448308 RepID=A0A2T2NBM6_CORCC|nr:hypothetical protein BS50DRAFT_577740 [Corynespora cassiicola Philippines]